jgi:protein required for attachment to host cells
MKTQRTWIVVADGAEARVLLSRGRGKTLEALPGRGMSVESKPSRDIMADRPSRSVDSVGGQRHAMDQGRDPHDEAERAFLGVLVTTLATPSALKEFDHLVMVAPARAMGHLRKILPDSLKSRLKGEFVRDYIHQSDAEVLELVNDALPV